ncbi:endonuclease [Mycoplasmatota bacterium]|nr:endonuclease [Mycoplasmatota bacterium]
MKKLLMFLGTAIVATILYFLGIIPDLDFEVVNEMNDPLLIISEFGEGSSNNKAIELANIGEGTADLSEYRLVFYFNEDDNPVYLELEGELSKGSVYLLTHSSFDFTLTEHLSGSESYIRKFGLRTNGDDEFSLEKKVEDSWIEIDVVGSTTERGQINPWVADSTLVRNYNIIGPNCNFDINEWSVKSIDDFSDLGNHSTSGNDTIKPVISVVNSKSKVLEIGSEMPDFIEYFSVIDNIDGEITITLDMINNIDLVDINTAGIYEIELEVEDESGNVSNKSITIRVYDPNSTDLVLTSYYQSVEGLTGDDLKQELNQLIDEHKVYTYDEVWDILKESDQDPNNPDNVLLLYTGLSYSKECQDQGAYSTCDDVWNREHVWSKSRGDFGTDMGPGTDLHHLRAADKIMNSTRNNRLFDVCDIEVGYGNDKCDYWAFEPRDEVKGDIARMLFYMTVRYEGFDEYLDLELNEVIMDKDDKSPFHGKLSLLLEWNLLDPVDDFERQRNEVIFNYQGNRNPFVDYPEFALMIFG